MATIVTRSGKGAALTHAEMDANFTNLNDELANVSLGVLPANSVSPTELQDSGDFTMATLTTTGTVTTGSHILPTSNNAVDLGSPTKMWRDIYVGPGSLYVNGVKLVDSDASAINLTTDASSGQEIFLQPDGHLRLASTAGDVIVQSSNTLKVDTIAGATSALIANDVPALSFSTGTNNLKLESSKLSRAAGNMEIETALGGGEYVHIETNDLYVGNFASALKITDATISAAPTNGDVTIAPDGTGKLKINKTTQLTGAQTAGNYLSIDNFNGSAPPTLGYPSPAVTIASKGSGSFENYSTLLMHTSSTDDSGYPNIWVQKNANDDPGTTGYCVNGERLFGFYASADRASGYYTNSAGVFFKASEAHSSTAHGGKIEFNTMDNGSTGYGNDTIKMTINDKIECNSQFVLRNLASDPSGATNGEMYYNTTSNKFRGYANGAWTDLH